MPIQLSEENGGTVIAVHVSGKRVKADYEHFVPEFERLVRQAWSFQIGITTKRGRLCSNMQAR